MAHSKKTTIYFPPDLHARLLRLARRQGTSLADLVRSACEKEYGVTTAQERLEAVETLAALALPAGPPDEIARESVSNPEDLLP